MIQSPLNYTGGKFKLLPQILPLFPKDIDRFFDFFCGGCNVSINVNYNEIICLDCEERLIYLYQTFQNLEKESVFSWIYDIIEKYRLSLVSRNGYAFYNCDSATGLGEYNRKSFQSLKKDFNNCTILDYRYYVMMYVIIVYAFNNQIRFNSKGEFNLPVGKRDFNARMQSKLSDFIDRIHSANYKFVCQDFRQFDIKTLTENDFVYADPPYLITCATYNENDGWNNAAEYALLNFLDTINSTGIRFALSNVLSSSDKKNKILADWLEFHSKDYTVVHLKHSYSNSSYHKINRNADSDDEVLILNYKVEQNGR